MWLTWDRCKLFCCQHAKLEKPSASCLSSAALAIEFTQVSTMQEYRINYTLLIGLIIGTFVCSGAIFGVHMFQNSRQSGWLISEAEKASAEKNYRDAAQYYQQYIAIHTDDRNQDETRQHVPRSPRARRRRPRRFSGGDPDARNHAPQPGLGCAAGNQKRPPSARSTSMAKTISATSAAHSTISSCCSKATPTMPICRFSVRLSREVRQYRRCHQVLVQADRLRSQKR